MGESLILSTKGEMINYFFTQIIVVTKPFVEVFQIEDFMYFNITVTRCNCSSSIEDFMYFTQKGI